MFPEPYNGFFAEGREKNWKEIIERKNKSRAETVGEVGRGPCRGQTLVCLVLEDWGASPPSCPSLLKEKNKWLLRTVLWKQADKTGQRDAYNMLQRKARGKKCTSRSFWSPKQGIPGHSYSQLSTDYLQSGGKTSCFPSWDPMSYAVSPIAVRSSCLWKYFCSK